MDHRASSKKGEYPTSTAYTDDPLSSSASVHSLQPYDYDESLPAYTDLPTFQPVPPTDPALEHSPLADAKDYEIHGAKDVRTGRSGKVMAVSLYPQFTEDAPSLYLLVMAQRLLPPQPYVRIMGSHTESSKDSQGKKTNNKVFDFDFLIDPGETMLEAPSGENTRFRHFYSVADETKAYRGGRMKTTGPHPSGSDPENVHHRLGSVSPWHLTIYEWCKAFCEDKGSIKSFTFERQLLDLDHGALETAITAHIRSLNYRGHINVSIETKNAGFTIYSPHWANRLRLNTFVWWLIVILQLWIIAWPVLWFMEHRYAVINCEWRFSTTVTSRVAGDRIAETRIYARNRSEGEWVKYWGKAIRQAAEGRRKGREVVSQHELELLEEEGVNSVERERRGPTQRGDGSWADAAVGLVRGISDVSQEVNRARGWGGDC